jgi:hypothetical protein
MIIGSPCEQSQAVESVIVRRMICIGISIAVRDVTEIRASYHPAGLRAASRRTDTKNRMMQIRWLGADQASTQVPVRHTWACCP